MISEAELLGIDLDQLEKERFDHPDQLKLHRQLKDRSQAYWNPPAPPVSPWLSMQQASIRTHYSQTSLSRWIKAGLLDAERTGKQILIHEDVLDSFITTRRAPNRKSD